MTNVEGTTKTLEAQSRNMMNICTKHGFDIFNSGSYGGHTQHMTYDGQRHGYDISTIELTCWQDDNC